MSLNFHSCEEDVSSQEVLTLLHSVRDTIVRLQLITTSERDISNVSRNAIVGVCIGLNNCLLIGVPLHEVNALAERHPSRLTDKDSDIINTEWVQYNNDVWHCFNRHMRADLEE